MKMQKLMIWVAGPTICGFIGQALGTPFGMGMAGSIVGSIIGFFVGWWIWMKYMR